jgi:chromosome partitioning protein
MYHVMTPREDELLSLEDIIITIKDNFDLAPSSIILSAVEQELAGVEGREEKLLRALNALTQHYHYIIIDCPPSIGLLCFNALRASKEVIIPIDMSLFSLRGVAKLMEIIILLKDKLGHDIKSRALITMYDYRTRYSKQVLEKVREEFGKNVFEAVIRYTIRLRETVDHGVPIGDFDKHSIGNQDYERLAEELLRAEVVSVMEENRELTTPHDILRRTEEYIEGVKTSPIVEHLISEPEEFPSQPFRSLYSDMVEAIALEAPDALSEDESETEL